MTSKASVYLHALSSDLRNIPPGIAFNVFLELMQRIHQNVRKTLFRFRWDKETIPLGHQRLYWKNVSTVAVPSSMSLLTHADN
jgi:hypothetical protein